MGSPLHLTKINVGTSVNARDGDSIRTAFMKVNGNFDSLAESVTTIGTAVEKTGILKRYEFTDSLEWVVQHNMNTRSFTESLTDRDGNKFYAKVKIVDENAFIVKLSAATSGAVDVYFSNANPL